MAEDGGENVVGIARVDDDLRDLLAGAIRADRTPARLGEKALVEGLGGERGRSEDGREEREQ
jgi:hypothetical protein